MPTDPAPADEPDELTLPQLAVRLGVSLDKVRREFNRRPDLDDLARRVGPLRVVRAADVERVRAILAAAK